MAKFVVVGAGEIGSRVTNRLVAEGHEVVVVSRRGAGPDVDGVRRVALGAADGAALGTVAHGAAAIFNCANPPYHRWLTEWPPMAAGLLRAAQDSHATLVTLGNLYAYGPPSGPMSPTDPLRARYAKAQVRAQMWRDALEAHELGLVRTAEVRASDFIGGRENTLLGDRVVPRVLAGRGCSVIGNPDAPHSWTFVDDVATTLVAVAQDPTTWGAAWHVPTNDPRSQRQVIDDLADAADVARVRISAVPRIAVRAAGLASRMAREVTRTLYQFESPFVIDDHATREHFGLAPTPWPEVITATLAPYRAAVTA
jgi:nucleoside-diphosphate-sugar epimerase